MADIRKVVEIAVQVTGLDKSNINGLATVFEKIKAASVGVNDTLVLVKGALANIAIPVGLTQTVEALKGIKDIKGTANLKKATLALKQLGRIEKFPLIGTFVNNLVKLNDVESKGVTSISRALKKLSLINVGTIAEKIAKLNTALGKLETRGSLSNFAKFASDLGTLKSSLSESTKAVKPLTKAFNDLGNTMQKHEKQPRSWIEAFRTVLQFRAISAVLQGVKTALQDGVTAIKEYDQGLKDLQAITGATGIEVTQMGKKILQVASDTKFSAEEIASGMKVIAQSGFSVIESIETMGAVANLATGTLSDMATTVDLMTTAMRVFNIDASRSGEVSDVFANAVNRSKLTIDKLRTAMNYLGPIARDSGVSFKELSAAMGTLANQGIRASTIGTGLRNVFAQLANPSKKLILAAHNAGVSMEELNPASVGLSEVISNLGLIVNDAGIAFDLFGKRGATAVLALSGGQGKFNKMLGDISRSGTAAQQAAIQMKGLGVSFKNLQDRIGVLAITLGNAGLTKVFKVAVDIARVLVSALTDIAGTMGGRLLLYIGAAATAFAGFNLVLTALSSKIVVSAIAGLGSLTTGLFGFTSSISLATLATSAFWVSLAPIALVLGGLTLAWTMFSDKSGDAADATTILANEIGTMAKKLHDYHMASVNLAEGSVELKEQNLRLRESLKEVAGGLGELAGAAQLAVESINPLDGIIANSGKALKDYGNALNNLETEKLALALVKSTQSIKDQGTNVKKLGFILKDMYRDIVTEAGKTWDAVIAMTDLNFKKMGQVILSSNLLEWGYSFAKGILNFSEGIDLSTASFAEMKKEAEDIAGLDWNASQKTFMEGWKRLESTSRAVAENMVAIGQVSLRDTATNFERITKGAKHTGTELDGIVYQLIKMKKSKSSETDNIVDKWVKEGDTKKLEALGIAYNKTMGESQVGVKDLAVFEAKKTAHITNLANLREEAAVAVSEGEKSEAYWVSYAHRRATILKAAEVDRAKISNDADAQRVLAFGRANNTLKLETERLTELHGKNYENLWRDMEAARAVHEKTKDEIIKGGLENASPKDKLRDYKKFLNGKKKDLEEYSSWIDVEVIKGVGSHAEGEYAKEKASLEMYKQILTEAKVYYKSIEELKGKPKDLLKAQEEVVRANSNLYDSRTKALYSYNKKLAQTTEKIINEQSKIIGAVKDTVKKEEEIKEKHLDKLFDMRKEHLEDVAEEEVKLADKIEKINIQLAESLKKIGDKRASNILSTEEDIADIQEDAIEKLRTIKQRSMTDAEKEVDNQDTAYEKLSAGIILINKAKAEGDIISLQNGQELIKQAMSLYNSLANQEDAITGIKNSEKALIAARNTESYLQDLKLIEKQQKAISEAAEDTTEAKSVHSIKLANIEKEYNKSVIFENNLSIISLDNEEARHSKKMLNLRLEEEALIKQWKVEADIQTLVLDTDKKKAPLLKEKENKIEEPIPLEPLPTKKATKEQSEIAIDSTVIETQLAMQEIKDNVDALAVMEPIVITVIQKVIGQSAMNKVARILKLLNRKKNVLITVNVKGVDSAIKKVNSLISAMSNLKDKSIGSSSGSGKEAVKKYGNDFLSSISNIPPPVQGAGMLNQAKEPLSTTNTGSNLGTLVLQVNDSAFPVKMEEGVHSSLEKELGYQALKTGGKRPFWET